MIVSPGIVNRFGDLISRAEHEVLSGVKEGTIEEEDSITDRFFGQLQRVFEEHGRSGEVEFHARKLAGRGPDSAESRYGADICGVLNIRFSDFQLSKGFLAQAKKEGSGIDVRTGFPITGITFPSGDQRLNKQIDDMLEITPDSFVVVYSKNGFVVAPASSLKRLKRRATVYGKPIERFFREFLMCFIGDLGLNGWDDRAFEVLRGRTRYRTAIVFDVEKH